MNGIEKFVTVVLLVTTTCGFFGRCESNPESHLCVFVKSWWKTILRPQADFSSYITAMLLIAVFEREQNLLEEGDDDLPIIEDDEFPFDFEEDPEEDMEGCTNDKDTTTANSFHPKLVPLLVSMFFMLFNIIMVIVLFGEGGKTIRLEKEQL